MAKKQTRRSISVSGKMYDSAKACAEASRLPLSALCEEALRKEIESRERIARMVESSIATPAPLERSARLGGIPGRVEVKRSGGYDPRIGRDHPNNQDHTLPPRAKL